MKYFFTILFLSTLLNAHSYRHHDNIEISRSLTIKDQHKTKLQKTLPKTISGEYKTITTEHFKIFYGYQSPGTSLWNDMDKNSYADYLDILKVELEYIWDKIIDEMGFKMPDANEKIEIFVSDTGVYLDGKYLELGSNYVGYSIYDESNGDIYMVINGSIGYYNGTSAKDLLRITLAHEFFHLVQYAYAHSDSDFYDKNIWLYEGTAVWMEYQVYPDVDDYINTYGNYITSVLQKGIVEESNIYPYSTNYLFDYLSNQSSDKNFIRSIWEKFEQNSNSIDAVEGVLKEEGKDFGKLLISYAQSLKEKNQEYFSNSKILFNTLDTSSFDEFYCNSKKTKYMGYYSVMLFNDENELDQCNVFNIKSSSKHININDGNETLAGTHFNTRSDSKGVVLIPSGGYISNSNYYVSFKMEETKSTALEKGWNLLGTYSDMELSNIDNAISSIWKYENGKWYLFTNENLDVGIEKFTKLKAGEGFWINSKDSISSAFENVYSKSQVCDFDIKSGWNLVSNKCIESFTTSDIITKYEIKSVWRYSDEGWLLKQSSDQNENFGFGTFENIESNTGYWFYK